MMKKTGAWLARYALEQIGVRWTFGIPGVHNTELYDELNESPTITPILVTHEGGGAFAADAVSRVCGGTTIGTLALVPAAGLTHAASGIGEAMLGGIPMLVLTGGIRRDSNRRYQLHDIDQLAIAKAITKGAYRVLHQRDVVPTIYEAVRLALSGEPGPVLVELPLDVLLFAAAVGELPAWVPPPAPRFDDAPAIAEAAARLLAAHRPGIFVGWGGRAAAPALAQLAELLEAPVATTLQGQASFPHEHPLHAGFGFGRSAVPAARHAFAKCDCLLAVGTRFSEIATGSYGVDVPDSLIHVDINPAVFHANYPAAVSLAGDAAAVIERLLAECRRRTASAAGAAGASVEARPATARQVAARIAADKAAYRQAWLAHDSGDRVNPARFFAELRRQTDAKAIVVVDDGNHTYLTAELFAVLAGGSLIVPTDFNAMGYAVPAAIGARLAQPQRETIAIVGDGAFLMTCMEIVTAVSLGLGLVYYVFCDGELAQIAQAQRLPYRRAPCTRLGSVDLASLATGLGATYELIGSNERLAAGITQARALAGQGQVVIVEVAIDYSKATAFTQGTIQTNFRRFSLRQKARILVRMARRSLGG
jgi:acetolactate synthase-1/2/3 large subunit